MKHRPRHPTYQVVLDGATAGRPNLLPLASGSEGSIIRGLDLRNGNRAIVALSGETDQGFERAIMGPLRNCG